MTLLCIKSHSQGLVKAGDTYTPQDDYTCLCGRESYDIGIREKDSATRCGCGRFYLTKMDILFIAKELFVEIGDRDELEQYSPYEYELTQ